MKILLYDYDNRIEDYRDKSKIIIRVNEDSKIEDWISAEFNSGDGRGFRTKGDKAKVVDIDERVNLSYKTPDLVLLRRTPPPHFNTDEILSRIHSAQINYQHFAASSDQTGITAN